RGHRDDGVRRCAAQGIRFAPDGKDVWVSHVAGDTFTVIDAKSRKVVANVNVGKRLKGIVFSPDGRRGYFALSGANQVAVIDVPGHKLVRDGARPGWNRPGALIRSEARRPQTIQGNRNLIFRKTSTEGVRMH